MISTVTRVEMYDKVSYLVQKLLVHIGWLRNRAPAFASLLAGPRRSLRVPAHCAWLQAARAAALHGAKLRGSYYEMRLPPSSAASSEAFWAVLETANDRSAQNAFRGVLGRDRGPLSTDYSRGRGAAARGATTDAAQPRGQSSHGGGGRGRSRSPRRCAAAGPPARRARSVLGSWVGVWAHVPPFRIPDRVPHGVTPRS